MDKEVLGKMTLEARDRKSAAVLSIWHCILTWFFMNAEKKHLDVPKNKSSTLKLFQNMETLRKIIHDKADNITQANNVIKEMVKSVTTMVKSIHHERWSEEIRSMMHEIMSMYRILKEHKVGSNATSYRNFGLGQNNQQRDLVFIITIWYWLAAWSVKLQGAAEFTKNEFLREVELNLDKLGNQIFTGRPMIKPVQDMKWKLQLMLAQNPDHWVQVLEHFLQCMVEAGSVRGHVKDTVNGALKTINAVQDEASSDEASSDEASSTTELTLHPKIIRPVTSRPAGFLFKKHIINDYGDQSAIVDAVHELKEPIGKFIEHLPETIEKIEHVTNDAIGLGKEVVDHVSTAVSTVYNDVKSVAETVHDEVGHLVHGIGEGVQKFAGTVSGWFHHIF